MIWFQFRKWIPKRKHFLPLYPKGKVIIVHWVGNIDKQTLICYRNHLVPLYTHANTDVNIYSPVHLVPIHTNTHIKHIFPCTSSSHIHEHTWHNGILVPLCIYSWLRPTEKFFTTFERWRQSENLRAEGCSRLDVSIVRFPYILYTVCSNSLTPIPWSHSSSLGG